METKRKRKPPLEKRGVFEQRLLEKRGVLEQRLLEKRGVFEQRLLEERLAGRHAYNDDSLITNNAVCKCVAWLIVSVREAESVLPPVSTSVAFVG